MATTIQQIKEWFSTGKIPTQEQFWEWLDSYWHKEEKIPASAINGLPSGNLSFRVRVRDGSVEARIDMPVADVAAFTALQPKIYLLRQKRTRKSYADGNPYRESKWIGKKTATLLQMARNKQSMVVAVILWTTGDFQKIRLKPRNSLTYGQG